MKKEMLLAVDDSSECLQAMETVVRLLSSDPTVHFCVLHCLPPLTRLRPGEIWDAESTRVHVEKRQKEEAEKVFQQLKAVFHAQGIPEERVAFRMKAETPDPGGAILEEAKSRGIRTLVLGRRGRSPTQSLLLGSVSSRVAHYAEHRTVWVAAPPVHETRKVLIAVEGHPHCRMLTHYVSEWLAPVPGLKYTILHLLPRIPPTFWDDGHILNERERKDRASEMERWRREWLNKVEKFMDEARHALEANGVPRDAVEIKIVPIKEGIARDLLKEVSRNRYQMIVIGRRSIEEKKPFLLGSHANKILHHAKATTVCLVGSH